MSEILEFKKKIIENRVPKNYSFVLVCIEIDTGESYLEHSEDLDDYQVVGVLELAKHLKMSAEEEIIEIGEGDHE